LTPKPIDTSQTTLSTITSMDIPILDLLRRAVTALERTAQDPTPEITDPASSQHQLLSAEIRVQIGRIGYAENDHAKAKQLLAALFPGKISLKELTMSELAEYARKLRQVENSTCLISAN
jgi:hypothetical protein